MNLQRDFLHNMNKFVMRLLKQFNEREKKKNKQAREMFC